MEMRLNITLTPNQFLDILKKNENTNYYGIGVMVTVWEFSLKEEKIQMIEIISNDKKYNLPVFYKDLDALEIEKILKMWGKNGN